MAYVVGVRIELGDGVSIALDRDPAREWADELASAAQRAQASDGRVLIAGANWKAEFTPRQAKQLAQDVHDGADKAAMAEREILPQVLEEMRRESGSSPISERAQVILDDRGELVGFEKTFHY